MHACRNTKEDGSFTFECIERAGGEFTLNCRYEIVPVNYCPICGARAPKQIGEPVVPVEPPQELDVDGVWDEKHGIRFLDKATKMTNGRWRCLAHGSFGLAVVEVKITEVPRPRVWEGDDA